MAGEVVFKAHYLKCMQEKTKLYWEQKQQQQVIIFPKRTILHPCLDVIVEKYVHDSP